MSAHVERFNRTIPEEFIDYHQKLLLYPDQFNRRLIPWFIWYNAERPHWALKLSSPVQFLIKEIALCANHGGPIQLLMPHRSLTRFQQRLNVGEPVGKDEVDFGGASFIPCAV
jgi:hypothetical protein